MSSLRQFKATDLFNFNAINLDSLTETYNISFYLSYLARWPDLFSVQCTPSSTLMAYVMGKAEGTGTDWHGHVTAITVAPEYRRLGLAQGMMALLERVSEYPYDGYFVDLFVRRSNKVAIEMYTQLGYSIYRTVNKYYNGETTEDAFGKPHTQRLKRLICSCGVTHGHSCGRLTYSVSMLGIPEIDRLVCLELNQDDLAQLVTGDYFYEQQQQQWRHQLSQERDDMLKDSIQAQSPDSIPTLTKYGRYVRTLPGDIASLLNLIHDFTEDRDVTENTMDIIIEYIIPRLYSLRIVRRCIRPQDLKKILSRCPNSLRRLSIEAIVLNDSEEFLVEEEVEGIESQSWTGEELKYLKIKDRGNSPRPIAFWQWLLRRCKHLESIWAVGVDGLTTTLAEEMLGMPNLDKIHIDTGLFAYDDDDLANKDFAAILSSSLKGWRVIETQSHIPFDEISKRALFKHLQLGYIANHKSVDIVGLEMSLESELDILQGLKNLRELHVEV
ncbi:N(alpha)-acetyltransferase 20, NatB catalytic subunit [Entomortierella chlamydospora]|uniref:N(Alpha)-acetyltransferase 20, NatB catalytic subunit n=1 Tax=Entomortierella chlamydospora TaxID=101097 RepID=A0A9P6T1W7_9FUNG|nr:N(alpha)-acetyltransferase 20, NatB catalytic subunit [Entomortierella chlamydospora]